MNYTKELQGRDRKRKTKILRTIIAVSIASAVFLTNLIVSNAYTNQSGVITPGVTNVQVRSGPGTNNPQVRHSGSIIYLNGGHALTITDETNASDGTWYKVSFTYSGTNYEGYIRGDFVTITSGSTYTPDADFEAYMTAQGFPESYKDSLRALHAKYPNWVFEAVRTGYNWSDVIANESKIGVNLVAASNNDACKSTDSAAYNWATNQWYGFDGSGWVCASPAMIEYCMDPRNYLNESGIFQFATLKYAAYQNAAGVSNILAGSFMAGNFSDTDGATRSYADTFVAAGANSGVNPYHLAARCRQEQGTNGTSGSISGTYSGYAGYFNYFNIGASPGSGNTSVVNGLIYAKNQGWNTRYKSIIGGAAFVANKYVNLGQNTLYFQKFNVVYTASLYTHQYMTNVQAAISEGQSLKKAYTDYSPALVFRIPVYNNMPTSASALPSTGNPNNWLSGLSVSGYSLTPGFSGSTTNYSLIVSKDTSSVTINASAVAGTSSISGTGTKSLEYGANNIVVTCTAQNGTKKDYILNITREAPPANTDNPSSDASITSPYSMGTVATGFTVGSSAADVVRNITTTNCTVKVLKSDGTENTGIIGTGNQIAVYQNNKLIKSYPVVIYGDLNGDGKISTMDLVIMKRQMLGLTSLSGSYYLASDVNKGGDGAKTSDLVKLKRHLLELSKIEQ